jgi:alanine racemase
MITCKDIAQFLPDGFSHIENIFLDSREIVQGTPKDLFIALVGDTYNGHRFIKDAYNKGIRYFLVSEDYQHLYPKAKFWVVDNSLDTFQKLATNYRSLFNYPILAISGSNGKTIVKEFIFHVLSENLAIERSPKSFNSQVGVPISVLKSNKTADLGIFEAGISQTGEMKSLQNILKPNWGLFTNIGDAHRQGFDSVEEKIKEKAKLFSDSELIFTCFDHDLILDYFINSGNKSKLFGWSTSKGKAPVFLKSVKENTDSTELNISYQQKDYLINIPFVGKIWIENSMHAFSVLAYMDKLEVDILERFSSLPALEMRFERRKGLYNSLLINDSYSNDLQSLELIIDQFKESQSQKILILSDFVDCYKDKSLHYAKVAELLNRNNDFQIIGIGNDWKEFGNSVHGLIFTYPFTTDFLQHFNKTTITNKEVLVKGARKYNFERIVQALSIRPHSTELEINLTALRENFQYFKSKIPSETQIVVMLKAFSYGAGAVELAKLLEKENIAAFAVAYVNEGIELRRTGIRKRILVLNHREDMIPLMIENTLEPEIYSLSILNAWESYLNTEQKSYPIHIKLDTGMHRLGMSSKEDQACIQILAESSYLKLESVFSHLSDSSSAKNRDFTLDQINKFTERSEVFLKSVNPKAKRHILNSNGILQYPEASLDWVRLGIGLFGLELVDVEKHAVKNVLTLKSNISQIKTVAKGESVGYNRNFIAEEETTIAIISLGYADGLFRSFGNGVGKVYVQGKPCTIIGDVCMDMIMIDISHLSNVIEGEEVIIFDGKYQKVEDFARQANTIAYEILCAISERVQRTYFTED